MNSFPIKNKNKKCMFHTFSENGKIISFSGICAASGGNN